MGSFTTIEDIETNVKAKAVANLLTSMNLWKGELLVATDENSSLFAVSSGLGEAPGGGSFSELNVGMALDVIINKLLDYLQADVESEAVTFFISEVNRLREELPVDPPPP